MGQCCEPCLKAFGLSSQYSPISNGDDQDKSVEIVFPHDSYHKITSPSGSVNIEEAVFHSVPDIKEEAASAKEFDMNSVVFKGTVVEQKFSNKVIIIAIKINK